jgi:hypothetical protein
VTSFSVGAPGFSGREMVAVSGSELPSAVTLRMVKVREDPESSPVIRHFVASGESSAHVPMLVFTK